MVSHTEEMFSHAEAQRAQSFSQSILFYAPSLQRVGLGRCVSKLKSDCLWGGCMLCFKLSKLPPLWEGGGGGLPQIHRKGSARRMQSRARSSYAEPQPSLAVHLNALQRYDNNLAPPNIGPRSVQISVKETTDKS